MHAQQGSDYGLGKRENSQHIATPLESSTRLGVARNRAIGTESEVSSDEEGPIEDITPQYSYATKTVIGVSNLVLSGLWTTISIAHFATGSPVLGSITTGVALLSAFLGIRSLNSRHQGAEESVG